MSYQRQRLSGSQNRQLSKEKLNKEKKVIASTPKLESFFPKNTSTNVRSDEEISSIETEHPRIPSQEGN